MKRATAFLIPLASILLTVAEATDLVAFLARRQDTGRFPAGPVAIPPPTRQEADEEVRSLTAYLVALQSPSQAPSPMHAEAQ